MLFFQISLKNSEVRTTHNTFRECRVYFSRNSCITFYKPSKYLAQFLSLNIFAVRSVRYVWVTCSVSSQARAFRFSYFTTMNFSERARGKESRSGRETSKRHSSPSRSPGAPLSLRAQSNLPTFFDATRSNPDRNSEFSYAPSS